MTPPRVSRRDVLKGLGVGAGVVTVGAIVGAPAAPYTQYTYLPGTTLADTTPGTSETDGELRVRVAWFELYNDELLETQSGTSEGNETVVLDPDQSPTYVEDSSGPIVTLSNVLPGDAGRVGVGVSVESVPDTVDGAALWYRLVLTADCENGVNEPESRAGDALPTAGDCDPGLADNGELAETLQTAVWEDTGVVGGVGGCNGREDPNERPSWSGSLREVGAALADGVRLGGDACLSVGDTRCLGFRWDLPEDAGNLLQGDSAGFDLTVVATDCAAPNPFEEVDA